MDKIGNALQTEAANESLLVPAFATSSRAGPSYLSGVFRRYSKKGFKLGAADSVPKQFIERTAKKIERGVQDL